MAVYTDVAEGELGAFLKHYPVGELLSYKGIAEGTENSNFLLHTSSGSYILTLYEKRVEKADLPSSARWLAGRRSSSPSSKGFHCGGRQRRIAPRSARRWRSCTWPAPIFR